MNIDQQKQKLQEELASLEEQLKTLGIHNPAVPEDWIEKGTDLDAVSPDQNDVADRTEEYDERRATLATLEGRYNDVKRALEKIEDGSYGVCEVSGEPIEEDRLAANPAARTCKEHMNSFES